MAKLSPPWVEYFEELKALFGDDPEVKLVFDYDEMKISLYVENALKADAMTQLLPVEKEFGNVKVSIAVIPANKEVKIGDLYREAFRGNPALSYVEHVDTMTMGEVDYVVFANKVVQFYDDNIGDVNGNKSTLYQEIAKDVFQDHVGVFFCTDVPAWA